MKIGIVDVGGGLRGIYAAGALDRCMDDGLHFDLGIGVSAGSANIASFIAGQRGRNFVFYTDYSFRKEYMSVRNFLRKKSLIDLEYIYGTLSMPGGENPFDYAAFQENPMDFRAVATEAKTGAVKYFEKSDVRPDDMRIFMASSAIPFVCHPYEVDAVAYFDGALGDAVPVEKALSLGCDRVVLLLTKPKLFLRSSEKDDRIAARIQSTYPAAAERLRRRARLYNSGVARAMEYENDGKVLIVAPDDTCGVDTLTRDKEALCRLYEKGYADAAAIGAFVKH